MTPRILIASTVVLLAGCAPQPASEQSDYSHSDIRDFRILTIDQPTYFHVDVQDIKTNHLFKRIATRKHCNRWREWRLQQTVRLKANYFRREDGTLVFRIDEPYAEQVFCG